MVRARCDRALNLTTVRISAAAERSRDSIERFSGCSAVTTWTDEELTEGEFG